MLGDVAVAVHPDDDRYRDLIRHTVVLPIASIEIPIIPDSYTDPTFAAARWSLPRMTRTTGWATPPAGCPW